MKFLTALLMLWPVTSFGQSTLSGRVLAQDTQEPIAYANIGIVNTSVGTISNPDGSFSLPIPEKFRIDTLLFSALGFGRVSFPLSTLEFSQELTVYLIEKPTLLEPLIISQKKEALKHYEFGNSSFNGGVLETDTTYAGRSIALLIENKEPNYHSDFSYPLWVVNVKLRIFKNNLDTLKFRIRIQAIDSTRLQPGHDLMEKSIVIKSTQRKGWLEVDLTPHHIQIDGPFFVTFEQILDLHDRIAIADGYRDFMLEHPESIVIDTVDYLGEKQIRKRLRGQALDLPGTFVSISSKEAAADSFTCYVRETSFGEWTRVRGIVTATVLLSNRYK
jgi:CarboxypepD_reg-like domain